MTVVQTSSCQGPLQLFVPPLYSEPSFRPPVNKDVRERERERKRDRVGT